jgi:hypothetical protein
MINNKTDKKKYCIFSFWTQSVSVDGNTGLLGSQFLSPVLKSGMGKVGKVLFFGKSLLAD